MLILLWCLIAAVVFVLAASMLWHAKDKADERKAWARLVELGRTEGAAYDPALVADLPEPALFPVSDCETDRRNCLRRISGSS